MLGLGNYNYEHFSREILDELERARFSGPAAGERAPDFNAATLDGETLRLSDYRGLKNVLLIFGSVTCPMTAASIAEINELYDHSRGDDVEFLFVYVREAHPGERIPAHHTAAAKVRAAELLRKEEQLAMPVLVDEVSGAIHRKYSKLPSPAFLIDRSGRVAFRSMWTNPEELASAIDELLELQAERRVEHVVVRGGEDLSMPLSYARLYSYRALERGGEESVNDFRTAMGRHWYEPMAGSSLAESLLQRPGRILAVTALTTVVLAGGLYAGFELRKRRLGVRRNPYRAYEKDKVRDAEAGTDYGAVGI
jgi:peroxiredoxin